MSLGKQRRHSWKGQSLLGENYKSILQAHLPGQTMPNPDPKTPIHFWRKKMGLNILSCSQCEFETDLRESLVKHLARNHGGKGQQQGEEDLQGGQGQQMVKGQKLFQGQQMVKGQKIFQGQQMVKGQKRSPGQQMVKGQKRSPGQQMIKGQGQQTFQGQKYQREEIPLQNYKGVQRVGNVPKILHSWSGQENEMKRPTKARAGSDFSCPHCTYTAVAQCYLTRHINTKHPKHAGVKCPKRISALPIQEKSFQCLFCPFGASAKCYLTRHINSTHPEEWGKDKMGLKTNYFPQKKKSAGDALTNNNIQDISPKEVLTKVKIKEPLTSRRELLPCGYCPYSAVAQCYLTQHMKRNHPLELQREQKAKGRKGLYTCDLCSFCTTTKTYLTRHWKRHKLRTHPIEQDPLAVEQFANKLA